MLVRELVIQHLIMCIKKQFYHKNADFISFLCLKSKCVFAALWWLFDAYVTSHLCMFVYICAYQQQSPVEQRYKELLALRDQYLKKLEELQLSDSAPSSTHLANSSTPNTATPNQHITHLQTPFWSHSQTVTDVGHLYIAIVIITVTQLVVMSTITSN